jgi:surface protein
VNDLQGMFYKTKFNGDISQWNTSNVRNMAIMFAASDFDGDISNWDVSNVENMEYLFKNSKFNGDISNWMPLKLENCMNMFDENAPNIPYWAKIDDQEKRILAINNYLLHKELRQELTSNNEIKKKIKV